jgi:glycosyltransferase involved in cell wall biosynthesis
MAQRMRQLGVEALVVPNGLDADAYGATDPVAFAQLRYRFRDRIVLTKMARWDPDKRWLETIDIVSELKRRGQRPLLLARGGVEGHGSDVLGRATHAGLTTVHRDLPHSGTRGALEALADVNGADIVVLGSHVDADARRLLFRSSDAVLANSRHEPFGLVGLEAMAVGGLACTGCSGEDYAVSGQNAVVLHTEDPTEFAGLFGNLRSNPAAVRSMRRAARKTAEQFAWPRIVEGSLLPRVGAVATRRSAETPGRKLRTALQNHGNDLLERLYVGAARAFR